MIRTNLLAVLCVGAAVVGAAGCSTRGQVDPDVMQIATTPLTCSGKTECDRWWQRAQSWVTDNSKYKVETSTDTLIQTAGPDGGKRALAYQITRAPNPDGTATIGFAAHCDGSLGCKPNPWQAGADFKQYVRGAGPATQRTDVKPAPDAMHPEARQGQSVVPSTGEAASQ